MYMKGLCTEVNSKSTTNLELNVNFNPRQSPRWQLKLCQRKLSSWLTNTHTYTPIHSDSWTLYKIVHKRATKKKIRAEAITEKLLVTINYMQQFKNAKKSLEKGKKRKQSRETKRVNNEAANWNGCQIKHLRELHIKRAAYGDWRLGTGGWRQGPHQRPIIGMWRKRIPSFGSATYTHTYKWKECGMCVHAPNICR